ncbi:Uncharacterised protein [Edwardsiella tarda]|nr:Uncharacterised protein [Edwardsiella tarda]
MRINKLLLAIGLVCMAGQAIADEASYQKDLQRYEQLKPQVFDILKISGELHSDMTDAVRQRENGNPKAWRAMFDKVQALGEQSTKALGDNPLDSTWGACISMQIMLVNYWQDLSVKATKEDPTASQNPAVTQSNAWYIQERMACLQRYVFGPQILLIRLSSMCGTINKEWPG